MAQIFLRLLASLIVRVACRVEVSGRENIPRAGKGIVAANHLGRIDALLTYTAVPREDAILTPAKKYQKVAFFRWAARALNAIWLDRFNADVRALLLVIRRLNQGELFVVAPEGTRSPSEALIEGKPGTAYIAAKTGAPIIPAAINGTEDRLVVAGLRRLRRARVTVKVGKAFTLPPLEGRDREAALKEYTDEIMCQIAALLPPQKRGVYADHPRLMELLSRQDKANRVV
jgi:1-acyl-sn-glycerol-3-phosphate acyltransferase